MTDPTFASSNKLTRATLCFNQPSWPFVWPLFNGLIPLKSNYSFTARQIPSQEVSLSRSLHSIITSFFQTSISSYRLNTISILPAKTVRWPFSSKIRSPLFIFTGCDSLYSPNLSIHRTYDLPPVLKIIVSLRRVFFFYFFRFVVHFYALSL